jgi:hypothetical protein
MIPEASSSLTTDLPIKGFNENKRKKTFSKFIYLETKRLRIPKKRSISPPILSPSSVTLNILSSNKNSLSPSNKNKKKRYPLPISQSFNDFNSSSNVSIPKLEVQQQSRPIQYPIPPPIDPRNPITWNVNDVCWYLNEVGCSFALKTVKEQVKINHLVFK